MHLPVAALLALSYTYTPKPGPIDAPHVSATCRFAGGCLPAGGLGGASSAAGCFASSAAGGFASSAARGFAGGFAALAPPADA